MGFIDNNKLRALLDEHLPALVGFNVIDGYDLIRVIMKNTGVAGDFPIQTGLGVGPDDNGFEAEFVLQFRLPLVAQMGKDNNSKPADDPSFQQFLDNEQCLNGFTHPDIIGDEQADKIFLF